MGDSISSADNSRILVRAEDEAGRDLLLAEESLVTLFSLLGLLLRRVGTDIVEVGLALHGGTVALEGRPADLAGLLVHRLRDLVPQGQGGGLCPRGGGGLGLGGGPGPAVVGRVVAQREDALAAEALLGAGRARVLVAGVLGQRDVQLAVLAVGGPIGAGPSVGLRTADRHPGLALRAFPVAVLLRFVCGHLVDVHELVAKVALSDVADAVGLVQMHSLLGEVLATVRTAIHN
jgi:hypothetical protein